MRKIAVLILSLVMICTVYPLHGQIAAVKVDDGSDNTKVEDIIIVFKMHFDIGYTDWAESVLQKYTTSMIGEALKSVDETASLPSSEQFVWTVPGWPMKYILENSDATFKSRAEKAVKEGRFAVHALPFTFETESSDLETLTRSMSFSSDICRTYGLPLPRGAKLTDVPSHSWVLPTILSNAGVKLLHIGCNPGSASPDVPTVFWWEGPDGSRLLTVNWAEYYGSGVMPPENWPFKTWMAMIHTHENTGAPTPEAVAAVLAEAREKAPQANIRIGAIEDFYDALMKENPEIPVIRGDMPDTWIHGYMSAPSAVKKNKALQKLIYQTESLNRLLRDWGLNVRDCSGYVDKAVEQCLLFDEHTFGLALSHGHQADWKYGDDFRIERAKGNYDFIEESWYEKEDHIHQAMHNIVPALRRDMSLLAKSVALDGRRVVVHNQLPYDRSGVVSLPMGVYKKDFHVKALRDAVTGKIIPVNNDGNILEFFATDIPAMGYKSFAVLTDDECTAGFVKDDCMRVDSRSGVLENRWFRIRINLENGSLRSVFDKTLKKEMYDEGSEYGFGEYIHERFGNDEIDRYNTAYVKDGTHDWADPEMGRPHDEALKYSCGRGKVSHIRYSETEIEVSATVFCSMENASSGKDEEYLVTYTLHKDSPYLEVNWYSDSHELTGVPEGGWLAFPFNVKKPRFHLGRPGAVVDPSVDFIKNTNTDYFFLNTGMAVTGKNGKGYGLNSPDAPAVSLGRTGMYRFSKNYVSKDSDVFVNLYNNQWGTNFTEWIRDFPPVTVYIWSVDDYDNASSLVSHVENTRSPMLAAYAEGEGGSLPVSGKGLSVSEDGVIVTAYCDNYDGEGTLLRLWEQAGKDSECRVSIPGSHYTHGVFCDLRGTATGEQFEITGDTFTIDIKAYAPVSVLLY